MIILVTFALKSLIDETFAFWNHSQLKYCLEMSLQRCQNID